MFPFVFWRIAHSKIEGGVIHVLTIGEAINIVVEKGIPETEIEYVKVFSLGELLREMNTAGMAGYFWGMESVKQEWTHKGESLPLSPTRFPVFRFPF
ncbi:hypothetical protein [Magnetospira sp. QH-2]|uniref:hypothetical protein n=1 Tax=Magnetospira sp. (strain QH-2) TaxID=1288970 RepID=UPI0003E815E3|nr:hypothetical protein [Magnetospira sp. QH-2]CCQ75769.1 Protein of unknown function [Magnetospira sp. QH-2]